MDPISLAIAGLLANAFIPAGAASAGPALGAAATAVATAPAWAVPGAVLGGGSLAGTGSAALGLGGAVANNPHAQVGVQNGINATLNTAKDNFAGSVNGLNIPGVPHITFN